MEHLPIYTNTRGVWRYMVAYDSSTKDFAVTVFNANPAIEQVEIIGHVESYVAGERMFIAWLEAGDRQQAQGDNT
jgi:hypothetical protein